MSRTSAERPNLGAQLYRASRRTDPDALVTTIDQLATINPQALIEGADLTFRSKLEQIRQHPGRVVLETKFDGDLWMELGLTLDEIRSLQDRIPTNPWDKPYLDKAIREAAGSAFTLDPEVFVRETEIILRTAALKV